MHMNSITHNSNSTYDNYRMLPVRESLYFQLFE